MANETVRRTFNINNFESLVIEGNGSDDNPHKAHLLAERDCLVKAQLSMTRIFNVRMQHNTGHELDSVAYSVVVSEISGIDKDLIL